VSGSALVPRSLDEENLLAQTVVHFKQALEHQGVNAELAAHL
jgi:hypothetical protein